MNNSRITRIAFVVAVTIAAVVLTCGFAAAQSAEIQGIIDGRSGATMTVKTQDAGNVVVLLSDSTQVDEVEGGLHMRKKQMGLTALVPGLPVQVKGTYNAQNQLAADSVKFKGSDLKTASDIQAGVAPAEAQIQAEQQKMAQQEQQIQQEQATDSGDAGGAGEARAGDRRPEGSHRGHQQALWRVGSIQHPG